MKVRFWFEVIVYKKVGDLGFLSVTQAKALFLSSDRATSAVSPDTRRSTCAAIRIRSFILIVYRK
jgi:hypothetical protein